MLWATVDIEYFHRHSGTPIPASRSTLSSGPRPAQQPASFPSMTTAGTLRTPRLFARSATLLFHVEHRDVARRTCNTLDESDRVLTATTARTEDFNFPFLLHDSQSP